MRRLKADFHTHCADDPIDQIAYSAEMLIDAAAQLNYDVLAITCHRRKVYGPRLALYAERRGLLLIPAIELTIEGKHVVVLNPSPEHENIATFEALRDCPRGASLRIAVHPFHWGTRGLGKDLLRYHALFDAVEYSSFYLRGFNPNRWAVQAARKHNLPIVGASDTHTWPVCDSTFSWIDADQNLESVLQAVRKGNVEVATRPKPLTHVARMVSFSARHTVGNIWRSWKTREVAPS